MAQDAIAYFKSSNGEVARVGDVGKTVIRQMFSTYTIDDLEVNFFYSTDVADSPESTSVGEINNIQIEPSMPEGRELKAGDAIIFGSEDLF